MDDLRGLKVHFIKLILVLGFIQLDVLDLCLEAVFRLDTRWFNWLNGIRGANASLLVRVLVLHSDLYFFLTIELNGTFHTLYTPHALTLSWGRTTNSKLVRDLFNF